MSQDLDLPGALNLWVELSGVDPSKTSFTWGDLGVLDMHKALKEALDLDRTEITGNLIFQYVASEYFKNRNFSVQELLDKPEQVSEYLAKSAALLRFLSRDEIANISREFSANMAKALEVYGATGEDVMSIVRAPHRLALLRRDAFRTLQNLSVHQFLSGAPEKPEVKPVYGKQVYRWDNINSMLKALISMPSGVTVNLIVHPTDPYRSYFAFAIRNGGNLFVFTDKDKTPHPLSEDLTRRPDKVLAAREARNWFPYELMGMTFTDDGKVFVQPIESRDLVSYQSSIRPLKHLSSLKAPTVVWLTMMLDLIMEKFWNEGFQAPALSYTGEMVKVNTPLIEEAASQGLVVAGYTPLNLPEIELHEIRSGQGPANPAFGISAEPNALPEDVSSVLNSEGTTGNWMEDRYGHLVTKDVLNLVASPADCLALNFDGSGPAQASNPAGEMVRLDARNVTKPSGWFGGPDYVSQVQLNSLDSTSFGTAEDIRKDRLFLARSNYAKLIQKHADDEFSARKKEILEWFSSHVRANHVNLLPLMVEKELLVQCPKPGSFDERGDGWAAEVNGVFKRRFMERFSLVGEDAWRKDHLNFYPSQGAVVFKGPGYKNNAPTCFQTGAPSSVVVKFMPETAEDLAFLAGVTKSDLPDVLQHWGLRKPYVGNHLLRRVDPMEWQCENPWRGLAFTCAFFFSTRAINRLEKSFSGRAAPTLPGESQQ